jgi:hypothetical protein
MNCRRDNHKKSFKKQASVVSIPGSLLMQVISFLFLLPFAAKAQKRPANDTSYFISYRQDVVLRIYGSEKYTGINIKSDNGVPTLKYRPNTKYSIGLGFTYRPLTINIGYGFGFLNGDKEKGKSKILDIKSHVYTGKFVLDIFAQHYSGFYLAPKGSYSKFSDQYYVRPDVKSYMAGISAFRVLNNRKLSYRAAFIQDTWQKKSAGSPLLGLNLFYMDFHGDSSLLPAGFMNNSPKEQTKSMRLLEFGPGVGYAYHLVLPLNLFIMGSLTANLNLNYVMEKDPLGNSGHISVNPGFLYRAAFGYSNGVVNVHVSAFNQRMGFKGGNSGNDYLVNTGNFRVTVAKRFQLGERGKKILSPIRKLNFNQ